MVLTDKEIRKLCVDDAPMISPFDEEKLQGASYDVSMSGQVSIFRKSVQTICLQDQVTVDAIYQTIDISNGKYVMASHEYILVSIQERVRIPENIIAHIRPRTRFTRMGLIVSSQHCNPTYEGNLQIGLFNASPNAIEILPGLKIAQLVFEQLSGTPTEEKLYKNKKNAAYQGESGFRGAKFENTEFSGEAQKLFEALTHIPDEPEG